MDMSQTQPQPAVIDPGVLTQQLGSKEVAILMLSSQVMALRDQIASLQNELASLKASSGESQSTAG